MSQPVPTPAPTPAPPAPAPTPAPVPTPPVPAPQPAPTPAPAPAPTAPEPPADSRDISHLPSWVQTEIRNTREEAAKHRVAARTERVNNGVLLGATQLGVNAQALLGSTSWAQRASQLDPTAPDFQAQLQAAVTATLAEAPWVAAQQSTPPPPPVPPTSGAEFPGGSGAGAPITEAQLAQMTPEQITQALGEGKLKHLL